MQTVVTPFDSANLPLSIRLFGPAEIRIYGQPLPRLRSRKGVWLLALLALRAGRAVDRGWLAGTLWPDSLEGQSLYSLRRSLADLRQALGDQARRLAAPTPHQLSLVIPETSADVLMFDTAMARGDPSALKVAVDLYRGDLLEGCTEGWVIQERGAREQKVLAALEKLADLARKEKEYGASIGYLRRIIAIDSFRESSYRSLMETLAESGDFGSAALCYRDLRTRLHDELNTRPDGETTRLFQHLRAEAHSNLSSSTHSPRRSEVPVFPSVADAVAERLTNLPSPVTMFIGRVRETAEIKHLVTHNRLVTLTGAGGCGKTRLALEAGNELLAEFPDGVWLVELAHLANPAQVLPAVASEFAVQEQPGRPLMETLVSALQHKSILVILDNCEHLIDACARVAELLVKGSAGLHILATSRIALQVQGGITWRVPSMTMPAMGQVNLEEKDSVTALHAYDSVRLFVERATYQRADFALHRGNASTILQICNRLDGIPLALELAAAWTQILSVEQIAARLDDRFRLLTRGNQGALPRHRTLRAALDWSYDLLDEEEKELLHRLPIFAGGWSLTAAEAILADPNDSSHARRAPTRIEIPEHQTLGIQPAQSSQAFAIPPEAIATLLVQLLDRSLVHYGGEEGEERFGMLETVREYAAQHPIQPEAEIELRQRHRDWYLALAEQAGPNLLGKDQAQWLNTLEREHDNLRAALDFCARDPLGVETGLRLVVALWRFWEIRGHLTEGRRRCKEALEHEGAGAHTPSRARALYGAGALAFRQYDFAEARTLIMEALAICHEVADTARAGACLDLLGLIALESEDLAEAHSLFEQTLNQFRACGDREGIAGSLNNLGRVARGQGDLPAAQRLHEESLAVWQAIGDKRGISAVYNNLGNVAHLQGDYTAARALYIASLDLKQEMGERSGIASVLNNLGQLALDVGDGAEARTFHEQALRIRRELGNSESIAGSLNSLGQAALQEGDCTKARAWLEESLALCRQCGDRRGSAMALNNLGLLAAAQGDRVTARQHYEESLAMHREIGDPTDIAQTLINLGELAIQVGDLEHGKKYLAEGLALRRLLEDRVGVGHALKVYAAAALAQKDLVRAVVLFAAAERLLTEAGVKAPTSGQETDAQNLKGLRSRLDSTAFDIAWREGTALSWEDAARLALGEN